MKMISQKTIGRALTAGSFERLIQSPQKIFTIEFILEYFSAFDPMGDEVI
jgi:hypothetical protein